MNLSQAADLLAALGHETRLTIYRLLVEAGKEGINAGKLSETLDLAPATLSFHLNHLSRSGLISGRQEGRFIFYATDYPVMDGLLAFLMKDCCQGQNCLPQTRANCKA